MAQQDPWINTIRYTSRSSCQFEVEPQCITNESFTIVPFKCGSCSDKSSDAACAFNIAGMYYTSVYKVRSQD